VLDPDDATDSLKMEEMLQEASKTARSEHQRQSYQSMLGGCTSCHSLAADIAAAAGDVEATALLIQANNWRLGVLIATFVGRGIVRPVRGMTAAMAELAAGETEVNISSRGTGHEMGAMAAALEVFKQNTVERARLEAGQKAQAEQAARAKQPALVAMADKVETEMGTTLKSIGGRTPQ
jgi:hypothetical protein